MSARTAALLREITFHVPVDRFEIVNGPRQPNWMKTMERLARSTVSNPIYVRFVFTLKTAASDAAFKRKLSLARIFNVEGTTFKFTALYSGRTVSGVYDMSTRTGWFSVD